MFILKGSQETWEILPELNIGGTAEMREVNKKLLVLTKSDKIETLRMENGKFWIIIFQSLDNQLRLQKFHSSLGTG